MSEDDYTYPPCESCSSHDELEKEFFSMKNKNTIEHVGIITSLKWIIRIGSSLVAGIGIIFFMVWALHSKENKTDKKLVELSTKIEYIGLGIVETKADMYKRIEDCEDEH